MKKKLIKKLIENRMKIRRKTWSTITLKNTLKIVVKKLKISNGEINIAESKRDWKIMKSIATVNSNQRLAFTI